MSTHDLGRLRQLATFFEVAASCGGGARMTDRDRLRKDAEVLRRVIEFAESSDGKGGEG